MVCEMLLPGDAISVLSQLLCFLFLTSAPPTLSVPSQFNVMWHVDELSPVNGISSLDVAASEVPGGRPVAMTLMAKYPN